MDETRDSTFGRILASLPGWIMTVSGSLAVAACLLAPAWLSQQKLSSELDLMKLQIEQTQRQRVAYHRFNDALAENDPQLIQRLAFYHLRLKPADAQPLGPVSPISPVRSEFVLSEAPLIAAQQTNPVSIESILHEPIARFDADAATPKLRDTYLNRAMFGDYRPIAIVVGMFLVYIGMVWPSRTRKRVEVEAETQS